MTDSTATRFTHRLASAADVPAIRELIAAAIQVNMAAFLNEREVEAVRESMGVDQTLIADGTYFVIETRDPEPRMAGCGGWGKRKTLYGGDATAGRDDSLSDPNVDAARIRAMYTHPEFTRQGIGSLLLNLGENAAREAGFKSIELGSTVPGEPLYLARGYRELSRQTTMAANGTENTIIHMSKAL
ncbi:MAG: GNAT family N-acetyltransferase [Pseudomonadota bacterium]